MRKYLIITLFFISLKVSFSQVTPNFGLLVETIYSNTDNNYTTGSVLGGQYRINGKFSKPATISGGYLFGGVQWSTTSNFPAANFFNPPSNSKSGNATFTPKFEFNAGTLPAGFLYFRAYVIFVRDRKASYPYYGNIIKIEIPADDGSFQINNNEITNGNIVSCNTNSIQLNGSTPTGGLNNTYTYTWQSSNDGSSWSVINSANTKDYLVPSIIQPTTNTTVWYRRIVNSALRTSTSVPVSLTYLTGTLPAITLTTTVQNDKASWGTGHNDLHNVAITAVPSATFGDYTVRWESSSNGTSFTEINGITGSVLTATPATPTWYRAKVFYQSSSNCLVTSNTLSISTVSDVDNNIYQSITYGTQTWLNPNLLVTKFNDNTVINAITSPTAWIAASTPAWCVYTNSVSYTTVYGNLYNWSVVNNTLNVCPSGYHVSTKKDWDDLATFVGQATAGGQLKAQINWQASNVGVSKFNFFQAMPGGYRSPVNGAFGSMLQEGMWWIKNTSSETAIRIRHMYYNSANLTEMPNRQSREGISIRCVKD